jgi:hypothetical protein
MGAPKIAELRKMSDDGLIAAHDQIADQGQPGVSYYLGELARRDQVRQAEQMLGYTRRIEWMTLVVTVATIVNVVIAFLHR